MNHQSIINNHLADVEAGTRDKEERGDAVGQAVQGKQRGGRPAGQGWDGGIRSIRIPSIRSRKNRSLAK